MAFRKALVYSSFKNYCEEAKRPFTEVKPRHSYTLEHDAAVRMKRPTGTSTENSPRHRADEKCRSTYRMIAFAF